MCTQHPQRDLIMTSRLIIRDGAVINRGTINLWGLQLPADISHYSPEVLDLFARHHIGIQGKEDEVEFCGGADSLPLTKEEVDSFLQKQPFRKAWAERQGSEAQVDRAWEVQQGLKEGLVWDRAGNSKIQDHPPRLTPLS